MKQSKNRSHDSEARYGGFSLIEVLVALSLLGVAMLLTLVLIVEEPRTLRRLGAHEEVLYVLEQTLEGIRAGRGVPLGRQEIAASSFGLPEAPQAQDLRIWSESEEESRELVKLTLTARYRVGGQWFDRSLETLVWSP